MRQKRWRENSQSIWGWFGRKECSLIVIPQRERSVDKWCVIYSMSAQEIWHSDQHFQRYEQENSKSTIEIWWRGPTNESNHSAMNTKHTRMICWDFNKAKYSKELPLFGHTQSFWLAWGLQELWYGKGIEAQGALKNPEKSTKTSHYQAHLLT